MNTLPSCLVALILLFIATDSSAQLQLNLTVPGVPTSSYIPPLGTGKLDFTDDDVLDPSFFQTDAQGNAILVIQDGANPTNQWVLTGTSVAAALQVSMLIGYFEIDGSNSTKEIVLAQKNGSHFLHPVVLGVDGTVLWDGNNTVLLTVANMEADVDAEEEDEEVVVYNPAMKQVEIWGN